MVLEAIPTPATVNGLPFHPLIVHAVVVLLPLTVLAAIGISIWPAMRRHLGLLVVLGAVVSLILVPVATSSGEKFRDKLGSFIAKRIHDHQEYAGNLLPWTAALLVLLLLTMVVDLAHRLGPAVAAAPVASGPASHEVSAGGVALATRTEAAAMASAAPSMTRLDRLAGRLIPVGLRAKTALLRGIQPVLSVLTIAVALVLVWYVYKTGDSGAKVVWSTGG